MIIVDDSYIFVHSDCARKIVAQAQRLALLAFENSNCFLCVLRGLTGELVCPARREIGHITGVIGHMLR